MKKRIATALGALALVGILVLSGCATTETGNERGATASATMETVETDIRLVVMSINSAGQNLAFLISPNQEDLAKAFARYAESVEMLTTRTEVYIEHSDRMDVEGRDYFDEWRIEGKTYANPQIRKLSEQRREEVSAVYEEIARASVGVRGALVTHVTTLEEIRTYFSTDLTPRGVQVMTPVALDAIADGAALNNSLEDVLGTISAVRYELASGEDR